MNRTEHDKNRKKKKAETGRSEPQKGASQKKRSPAAKVSNEPPAKSLIPLLIILILLLMITIYLSFGESSSILSSLISRDTGAPPTIERPEIIQSELPQTEQKEKDSFAVTKEVDLTVEKETKPESNQNETPSKEMKSRLFFVKVSDEGQISLKSIIRSIPYETAPLTETIHSLMLGPDRSDLNKGLLNLIPQDSQLLSVRITGGTAFLDFNENFRYNSLGFEGYKAQLMQIVYTATEFDSVSNVQILIGGEKLEYLGAEGVYIGEPLDRDYFNTF
ncbi:MAG: GerMN domain-containing protein [Spirochaetales bacterium]|nr:GerMN domain-containing protein [Spirochaetales bacterium]